jgi:hypothetical protein
MNSEEEIIKIEPCPYCWGDKIVDDEPCMCCNKTGKVISTYEQRWVLKSRKAYVEKN